MRAKAFAPASIGNVAVGFDILGLGLPIAGDTVTVEKIPDREVQLATISGVVTQLPSASANNTATAGLVRLIQDLDLPFGFKVSIEKGIPLGSGMGGSAASAVAAVVAANELLPKTLPRERLLSYALIGEGVASGSVHADNVAPSLFGGLTLALIKSASAGELPQADVVPVPLPAGVSCVLVHPALSVETKQARGILRREVSLHDFVNQSAQLAGFLAACFRQDLGLLGRYLNDLLIEPQRAQLIPGFHEVKKSALAAGALGCSISGAGPSMFAWVAGEERALQVKQQMVEAFAKAGVQSTAWSVPLSSEGARVIR